MRLAVCIFLVAAITAVFAAPYHVKGCFRNPHEPQPSYVVSPLPHEYLRPEDVPKEFEYGCIKVVTDHAAGVMLVV